MTTDDRPSTRRGYAPKMTPAETPAAKRSNADDWRDPISMGRARDLMRAKAALSYVPASWLSRLDSAFHLCAVADGRDILAMSFGVDGLGEFPSAERSALEKEAMHTVFNGLHASCGDYDLTMRGRHPEILAFKQITAGFELAKAVTEIQEGVEPLEVRLDDAVHRLALRVGCARLGEGAASGYHLAITSMMRLERARALDITFCID